MNHRAGPDAPVPSLRIVLVRPRNPLNIGAAARAMANFGFDDLVAVDPYGPKWREARSAVGAAGLLASARALPIEEALEGCAVVLGTSDGRRKLRQTVLPLPELPAWLDGALPDRGRVAVLFGSEKTGLTNHQLSFCHALVRIPTRPETPSMNLGQAVAVVAYELARTGFREPRSEPKEALPGAEQLEDLVRLALAASDRLDFMRNCSPAAKAERLRRMRRRWRATRRDAALIQSLLRRVTRADAVGSPKAATGS